MLTMVTTTDNPYDYFTDFENWNAFDKQKGYNTLAYLTRIVQPSPHLPNDVYEQIIEDAVDQIVQLNLTGNYKKVVYDEK